MLQHLLTLIWNKKRQHFLLFLELFVSFLVLFAVFTMLVFNYGNMKQPRGLNTTMYCLSPCPPISAEEPRSIH